MKKHRFKKIVSIFLGLLTVLPLMGVVASASNGDSVSDGSRTSDAKESFPFDENILLSIFWPPTEKYITDEQYKLIADAGINWVMGSGEETLATPENQAKMLKLCAKYGLGMTVSDGSFGNALLNKTEEEIAADVKRYENVPGAEGFYIRDEPMNPNIFLDAYIALKKAAPDKYMHLNFLPQSSYPNEKIYKAQMNDWCRLAADAGYPLDYLMFDKYPFPLEEGTMNRKTFFENVRNCYEVGLENDVKTGLYIQTVCQEVAFRRPTDSEIRYEMYAALAFGFKQLSFFTWFTPENRSEPFKDGIISADGKPNPHYKTIKTINHEIHNIGSTLVKCDALEVYFNGKTTYSQPKAPDDFFVKADEEDSIILSFLRHKETGRNYLMVVNNDFSQSQEINLTFNDNIKSLWEVSKSNGSLKEMKLDNQKLNIELAAGDGMFFALPEDFDHYKAETAQPAPTTNLAKNSLITAPESVGDDGWYISYLQDGKRKSNLNMQGWKSQNTAPTHLNIDLKRKLKFNRIDIYPAGNDFERGSTMPSEITISVSDDGKNFTNIKTITDLKIRSIKGVKIDVPTTEARYIRLDMKGSNGGSCIALNEIEIYNDDGSIPEPEQFETAEGENVITYKEGSNIALKKSVFCSTTTPSNYKDWGWAQNFINDGKTNNGWSSNVGINRNPLSTEYIIIDFGDVFGVDEVVLCANGYFPEDYFVELSSDGFEWSCIQDVKGAPEYKPGEKINIKVDSPIAARYIRVTGTKLRGGGNDGYLLQLGEIEAYGNPICDKTELGRLIDTYLSKGGSKLEIEYKDAVWGMENTFLTQTQANNLIKSLSPLVDSLKGQDDDVSTPSEDSSSSESSEEVSNSTDDNESDSKTIFVVIGICVAITAIGALIVLKRKRK